MARLSDHIKSTYEDQTLALFVNFRKADGGPEYQYVGEGERPDRRIRLAGESDVIGVEITRIVESEDAAARSETYHHSHAIVSLLESEEPHGVVELFAGDWPDTSREGTAGLVAALRDDVLAAGGVREFIKGLKDGFWDYPRQGATVCRFCFRLTDAGGWKTWSNAVRAPIQPELPVEKLDKYLLERVFDKAKKVRSYPWDGPLFLLIRNTYQAYRPSADALAEVGAALGGVVEQAWLVNYREGVADASPPEPRLVRLA